MPRSSNGSPAPEGTIDRDTVTDGLLAGVRRAVLTSAIHDLLLPIRLRLEYRAWLRNDCTGPAPRVVKHDTVIKLATEFTLRTFVETGTYLGTMVNAVKHTFSTIYSIELDRTLASHAARRFVRHPHIRIIQGNSSVRLAELLATIEEPALFWLDAHFSGGVTASGGADEPIMREVQSIGRHPLATRHVVLVDDARSFAGANGYPTLTELLALLSSGFPTHEITVRHDMVIARPGRGSSGGRRVI
jgi:hypothetical protein